MLYDIIKFVPPGSLLYEKAVYYSNEKGIARMPRRGPRRSDARDKHPRPGDVGESSSAKDVAEMFKNLSLDARKRREWPKHRSDIENAFREGYDYTPVEFVTDRGEPVKGVKSITKAEMVEEMTRSIFFSPEEFELTQRRETVIKDMQKARQSAPGKSDKSAWEKYVKKQYRKLPGYIEGSVRVKTAPNPDYNCYSKIFTKGRGGHIPDSELEKIIEHNEYKIIDSWQVGDDDQQGKKAGYLTDGDLVILGREDGTFHAGAFKGFEEFEFDGKTCTLPMIDTKFGSEEEAVHNMFFYPDGKGITSYKIFRSERSGGLMLQTKAEYEAKKAAEYYENDPNAPGEQAYMEEVSSSYPLDTYARDADSSSYPLDTYARDADSSSYPLDTYAGDADSSSYTAYAGDTSSSYTAYAGDTSSSYTAYAGDTSSSYTAYAGDTSSSYTAYAGDTSSSYTAYAGDTSSNMHYTDSSISQERYGGQGQEGQWYEGQEGYGGQGQEGYEKSKRKGKKKV